MKIRKDFLATRDFDWFCIVSGIPIHAASAGGIVLPDLINDRKKLIESQVTAYNLPNSFENIFINTNCIIRKLQEEDEYLKQNKENDIRREYDGPEVPSSSIEDRIELYASSFMSFAHKGFFSFDRSFPEDPESTLYDLIAFPLMDKFMELKIQLPFTQNNLLSQLKSQNWLLENLSMFEQIDFNKLIK